MYVSRNDASTRELKATRQEMRTSRVAMHMHELLWGRHLLLLRAAECPSMGELRLWMMYNGLGLGVHPGQASVGIHMLDTATHDRGTRLMRQRPVWRRLLHAWGLRVHEGVVWNPGGRPLLRHAMR